MATVGQISAAYENFLLPVLDAQSGVCSVCRSTSGDFTRCWQCNQARQSLTERADTVVPVGLAVKGGQFAGELSSYKNSSSAPARRHLAVGLSAVLWRWLSEHEGCVAAAAGADEFSVVTHVPSTSGRANEPLQEIVENLVGATRDRYAHLLEPTPGVAVGRDAHPDRYRATHHLRGDDVLLVDDTWTTGGHAQSAACALKQAGAGRVAIVVLGRHFTPQPPEPYREEAEDYLKRSRAQGWSWERCCVH